MAVSIIVDALIVVVAVIIVVNGIRLGFVKSVMGLLKGIVSFIAAYAFTPYLGGFIKERFILPAMSSNISGTIGSLAEPSAGIKGVTDLFTDVPDAVRQIMDRYGSSGEAVHEAVAASTSRDAAVKSAADAIASPIAGTLSNCIAFVLIFAAVFLAFVIVTAILDKIFRLPVLNVANRAFGAAFGVLEAVIFAYVLSNVSAALIGYLGSVNPGLFGQRVIDNSHVMRFFLEHDIFSLFGGVFRG